MPQKRVLHFGHPTLHGNRTAPSNRRTPLNHDARPPSPFIG